MTIKAFILTTAFLTFGSGPSTAFNQEQPQSTPTQGERRTIYSADELPRFSYAFDGQVSQILEDPAMATSIFSKLRADIHATLELYDIQDKATLRNLHYTLRNIALVEDDRPAAQIEIEILKGLQEKEADRLISGRLYDAYFDALRAGPIGAHGFDETFKRRYAQILSELPWSVVGRDLKEERANAERLSSAIDAAWLDREVQPRIAASGAISGEDVAKLASVLLAARISIPLRTPTLAVLEPHILANDVAKPDIWAERGLTFPTDAELTPVVIAVWDSGVDTSIFEGRLWTNIRETANGLDDDANGHIDDLHGLGFDSSGRPSVGLLAPVPADVAVRLDDVRARFKGYNDQLTGLRTPDAAAVVALVSQASPERATEMSADFAFFSEYAHGTHVAGIAMDENPAARLLTVRATSDWAPVPILPTLERAEDVAKMHQSVVDYMKAAKVRVVNISWGFDVQVYERALEAHGVPLEERRTEARKLFEIESEAFRKAIASAPEILFVVGAGNSNNDVRFAGGIPASIEADNVMTVAAVDHAGDPTGFTTGGTGVDVAASGYQVESVVPGGQKQQWSGTSMASPQVVNLAGRLLALRPDLSLRELRSAIEGSATPGAAGQRLIHPAAALASQQIQTEGARR